MLRLVGYGLVTAGLLAGILGWAQGGQGAEPIPLWPAGAPGETGDVGEEGTLPARPNDSTVRVNNVTRPTMTVFRPSPEKDTGASVLVCPGGAYNILAYNKEGTEVAEWLNTLGVTGIVLKYRVPARKGRERHAAALQDGQRALSLIRHRAKSLGIDPQRIGVLGFSAGGHLAALLCSGPTERAYEPIDEADRVEIRPNFCLLIYPAYLATKENTLAAPLHVTSKTPPTFLVQTEDDSVRVESSLVYYAALKEAKVPAEMHLYPSGGHGYGLRPSRNAVSTWPRLAESWMASLGVLARNP